MEDDNRAFQAVAIGLTSIETGRERFTKDNVLNLPPISSWRCNSTALSQRYNLYFVGSGEGIAVYQPDFPFQKLGRTPQLYVPLAIANSGAKGYIQPSRPHEINHIIVGDLGSEEIILVATDSGNVAAYYTKIIDSAIRKDPYRLSTNARSDHVGVRAFFSQWVDESAWGLAIHRAARMIAVSANKPRNIPNEDPTSKVTVFSFALCQKSDSGADTSGDLELDDKISQTEWHDWHPSSLGRSYPPRDLNYRIVLGGYDGHQTNIPSISFVNTSEDAKGVWLLSTDIYGVTKAWQIWKGFCYATTDLSEQPYDLSTTTRRREGGWLVAALESSAFRPTTSMAQFCGHSEIMKYRGHPGESYDITDVARFKVPGNSQHHPLAHTWSDIDDTEESEDQLDALWQEDDSEGETYVEEPDAIDQLPPSSDTQAQLHPNVAGAVQVSERSTRTASIPNQPPHQDAQSNIQLLNPDRFLRPFSIVQSVMNAFVEGSTTTSEEDWIASSDDEDEDEDDDDDAENDGFLADSEDDIQHLPFSPLSNDTATSVSSVPNQDVNDPDNDDTRPISRSSALNTEFGNLSTTVHQTYNLQAKRDADMQSRLPFIPTLHCSTSHLRLLNLPHSMSPHVVCRNMLIQTMPQAVGEGDHPAIDRLNMMQQIPELGIVVIATQIGRCAVCSLTKNASSGLLGLRVDWVLPTTKQERAGLRPTRPLLGIATAPVQGRHLRSRRTSIEIQDGESWTQDRMVDGISTTFDREVLIFQSKSQETEGDHLKITSMSKDKGNKRKRLAPESESGASHAIPEQREWKHPTEHESWESIETSRRYRLMMTYADMTVLTYELSRGIEKDDVVGSKIFVKK